MKKSEVLKAFAWFCSFLRQVGAGIGVGWSGEYLQRRRRRRRMVERRRRWRSPIVRSASPLLTHQSPSCCTQTNINKCKLVVTELSRAWAESLVSDEMSYMSPSCHKQATIRQCCRLSFHLERRSPQPYESGCRKCMALKKYLQDHRSSWKRLSALLCPSTLHCSLYFCFKFIAVAAGATFVNCLLLISRIWMIYALLPYRFTHFVCSFFRLKISFANYLHLECMVRLIWCLHFYHLALINITTK